MNPYVYIKSGFQTIISKEGKLKLHKFSCQILEHTFNNVTEKQNHNLIIPASVLFILIGQWQLLQSKSYSMINIIHSSISILFTFISPYPLTSSFISKNKVNGFSPLASFKV